MVDSSGDGSSEAPGKEAATSETPILADCSTPNNNNMREHQYKQPQRMQTLLFTLPFLLVTALDLVATAIGIVHEDNRVASWVMVLLWMAIVLSGVVSTAPLLLLCRTNVTSGNEGLGFLLLFLLCQLLGMLVLDPFVWVLFASSSTLLSLTRWAVAANLLRIVVCGLPCCLVVYRHEEAVREGII